MSKAEMSIHNVDEGSLRFVRQDLDVGGREFSVVDLVCTTKGGDQYRMQMYMDDLPHARPVTVSLGGLAVKDAVEARQPSKPVRQALAEYLEHLEDVASDATAHGRNDEAGSCTSRADEVRRLIGSTKEGGDDGPREEDS